MKNDILYVILNGFLDMSGGKAAAQAVHAAKMISKDNFTSNFKRSVIVLQADNCEQMRNLHEYLDRAGIKSEYYIDEGKNEVDAFSLTALAVHPFDSDDLEKREIFESFPLYGATKDYDDDYNPNTCAPAPDYRDVECARLRDALTQSNAEVRRLQAIVTKPKWYKRLFKRKQSWVS